MLLNHLTVGFYCRINASRYNLQEFCRSVSTFRLQRTDIPMTKIGSFKILKSDNNVNLFCSSNNLNSYLHFHQNKSFILYPHLCCKNKKCNSRIESVKNWIPKMLYSNDKNNNDVRWNVLYKFHHIRLFQMVSRFKIYQIIFMTLSCFPIYKMYVENQITYALFKSAIAGYVGTSVIFLVFSYFAMKVVGQIMVNDKNDAIKISRLSFFGRRTEDFIKMEDIIPWSDLATFGDDKKAFRKLYVDKNNGKTSVYLYSLKYGNILDKKCLGELLGIYFDE